MSVERANTARSKPIKVERRIKMPNGKVVVASTDAKEIAEELRKNSKLGQREAKLRAAEASLG